MPPDCNSPLYTYPDHKGFMHTPIHFCFTLLRCSSRACRTPPAKVSSSLISFAYSYRLSGMYRLRRFIFSPYFGGRWLGFSSAISRKLFVWVCCNYPYRNPIGGFHAYTIHFVFTIQRNAPHKYVYKRTHKGERGAPRSQLLTQAHSRP